MECSRCKEALSITIGENKRAEYWLSVKKLKNSEIDNLACISPLFKFSKLSRKVIYMNNSTDCLNSGFRQLNCWRTTFPKEMALFKTLYLAIWELMKKWIMPIRNGEYVYPELKTMLPSRLTRN